jgi:hypothetical protein
VIGPYRQLAVATVDQHRQPDGPRAPEVDKRVHGAADGAARVEHVVDQHDRCSVQVEGEVRAFDDRLLGDERQIIAVEGDVQRADREPDPLVLLDGGGDAMRQGHPSSLDADQSQALGAGLLLDYLMRDTDDGAPDLVAGHDLPVGHRTLPATGLSSFPASRCRSLKVLGMDTAFAPALRRSARLRDLAKPAAAYSVVCGPA